MPTVIDDQPWPPDAGEDLFRPDGSPVLDPATRLPLRARHDQLVVWAVLAPGGSAPPAGLPLLPVVLDTGFNDTFLMQQEQANDWLSPTFVAGLTLNSRFLQIGPDRIEGRYADLWLYPNVPGTRDPDPSGMPVRLELPSGAWLVPPGTQAAKEKPLLGLLAIAHNGLTLRIDGLARRVWVDAP
ncbi:MAG: hypothetical protein K2X87_17885 [Gemmataceae bacterium]|nr:hypothetical protein [Gemmataceae bacterium]